jgi:hypothetical protein
MRRPISLCLCAFAAVTSAQALDVMPSKRVVPEKFIDPGGKQLNILNGDPKRIQKANAINFADFEKKLELSPQVISLSAAKENPDSRPVVKVTFSIKNTGKKTYTLSFPDAQRYDITVKDASGKSIYTWSADKEFAQSIGTLLVNYSDRLTYSETLSLGEFFTPPMPGSYTVEAVMSNYPQIRAAALLIIEP